MHTGSVEWMNEWMNESLFLFSIVTIINEKRIHLVIIDSIRPQENVPGADDTIIKLLTMDNNNIVSLINK